MEKSMVSSFEGRLRNCKRRNTRDLYLQSPRYRYWIACTSWAAGPTQKFVRDGALFVECLDTRMRLRVFDSSCIVRVSKSIRFLCIVPWLSRRVEGNLPTKSSRKPKLRCTSMSAITFKRFCQSEMLTARSRIFVYSSAKNIESL